MLTVISRKLSYDDSCETREAGSCQKQEFRFYAGLRAIFCQHMTMAVLKVAMEVVMSAYPIY